MGLSQFDWERWWGTEELNRRSLLPSEDVVHDCSFFWLWWEELRGRRSRRLSELAESYVVFIYFI